MSRHAAVRSERAMTIVEVLVGVVILAVGVLGTVAMIDAANATTAKTKAREGGTNVGRSVLEVARSVPYRDLSEDGIREALDTRPGLRDTRQGQGKYTIESRGVTYTLEVTACSVDDEKDGLGEHDETIDFCADTDAPPAGQKGTDRNPDDYRRVAAKLSWTVAGATGSGKQTAVITNPVGGLGPSVTDLRITNPTSTTVTSTSVPSFLASTSSSAAEVSWYVNGDFQGKATGSGITWTFNWDLDSRKADGNLRFPDCTYLVQAEAFDAKGRPGAPKSLTVKVNRFRPVPPQQVEAGRNLNGDRVDVQWLPNEECDVLGYQVLRGTTPTDITTPVTCTGHEGKQYVDATSCLDEGAPGGLALFYQVRAVDTRPDGSLGLGELSVLVPVLEGNNPPTMPEGLTTCAGGESGCTDMNGNATPAGSTVLRWDASTDPDTNDGIYFYRIYRDGETYADRYDVLFPADGKPLVYVDGDPGAPHDYRISAVDLRLGESQLSEPVTR